MSVLIKMQRSVERFLNVAKKVIKPVIPDSLLNFVRPSDLAATPSNSEPDFLTFAWLRRQLAELHGPAPESYFAISGDEIPIPSLGAPESSFAALIDLVVAVSMQSDLKLVYMVDGTRNEVPDHEQLSRTLTARPTTKIHLGSAGREFTFYVEKWRADNRVLQAPRTNPITMKLYVNSPSTQAFLAAPGTSLDELYSAPMINECTFDVDVVYTWVNSDDPQWREMLVEHTESPVSASEPGGASPDGSVMADRFVGRDELKYSLRSLVKYAPWVRHVHIVTNCKPPDWFDESNDRVRWVYHDEIMDADDLPTFNSHAIEASIHRVPDLPEHFLYFNDDIFLVKPVSKSDFFLSNGLAKTRPEPYGTVQGEVNASDPDYVNAARNGLALLQSEFGKTASAVHTHSPQSMRLSVVQACEVAFPQAYEDTRGNKFRTITDISPASFLYPNFAYLIGHAVLDFPKTSLVNVTKPYRKLFNSYTVLMNEALMNAAKYSGLPLTLCINDGGGSTQDDEWGEAVVDFMRSAFVEMSDAEKSS